MSDRPTITRNEGASRFETTVDGHLAELVYREDAERLVLVHTGVPEEIGGRGIAGVLVETAIRYAAEHDLAVVAQCPYARHWLDRHPDVAKTVTIEAVR